MKLISRNEEIILLAIWRLEGNAYGVTIRDQVAKVTGRQWNLGAVYVPLDTLTQKEYVRKYVGDPVAVRGGRRKTLYTLTSEGKAALQEIREIQTVLWKGIPETAFQVR